MTSQSLLLSRLDVLLYFPFGLSDWCFSQYKMTITPESMTFNGSALWRDVILLYSVSFDTLSVCLMFTALLRNFLWNTSTLFGRPLDSVQSSELYMKTFTM